MPLPAFTESDDPLSLDHADFSEEALQTQQLLLAAANHDVENIRILLRSGVTASSRDEETGWMALHAAIASVSPSDGDDAGNNDDGRNTVAGIVHPAEVAKAEKTVKLLLDNGASWKDIDANDETPGCLALRLGLDSLYGMMVDAGVRAELLVGRLDGYVRLSDEEADMDTQDNTDEGPSSTLPNQEHPREAADENTTAQSTQDNQVPRPLDILAWENIIKHRTADTLISQTLLSSNASSSESAAAPGTGISADSEHVYCILSITKPDDQINGAFTHLLTTQYPQLTSWELHIVHETSDTAASASSLTNSGATETTTASFPPNGKVITHNTLSALETFHSNTTFDAIYLDPASTCSTSVTTNSAGTGAALANSAVLSTAITSTSEATVTNRRNVEQYTSLHAILSTHLPSLLSETGRFSFFNTLGSQRQVSYDVYTKVIEIDCLDAGFEVDWTSLTISAGLAESIERLRQSARREWCIRDYRMPIIRFE